MGETWWVNASPIIVLAKAGLEHLLGDLCPNIRLPESVACEVLAGPPDDPARKLIETGWGHRASVSDIPLTVLEWGLGRGESEVIAGGLRTPRSTVVLDDALARSCAKTAGLPVLGTLGVILRAKHRGILASALEALTAVRDSGLYVDEQTITVILHSVGERWPTGS